MAPIFFTLKLLFFILWSIPVVLFQIPVLAVTRGPLSYKIPRLWHRGLCWAFGMTVRTVGTEVAPNTPAMYISNHTSHFDILAIGTKLEASFVSKDDVAKWPLIGFLANLQQTAYISRNPKHALREKYSLQSYLRAGKSIILFPEGTTDDGYNILPFKSSLFALALEHELTNGQLMIQPFSLRLIPKPGKHGARDIAKYPWAFDDMTPMATHLFRFWATRGCIIELVFHAPVDPKQFDDRKLLCDTVREMIIEGHKTGAVQSVPPIPRSTPAPTPLLEKDKDPVS